jgi:hypothetical protein
MSSTKERNISFSIELVSRNQVKRVSLPDGSGDRLMVEGYLGELTGMELVEDILLEIRGTSGVLRIELSREELENALKRKRERSRHLLDR